MIDCIPSRSFKFVFVFYRWLRNRPRGVEALAEARLPDPLLYPLPRAHAGVRQGAQGRHLPHVCSGTGTQQLL